MTGVQDIQDDTWFSKVYISKLKKLNFLKQSDNFWRYLQRHWKITPLATQNTVENFVPRLIDTDLKYIPVTVGSDWFTWKKPPCTISYTGLMPTFVQTGASCETFPVTHTAVPVVKIKIKLFACDNPATVSNLSSASEQQFGNLLNILMSSSASERFPRNPFHSKFWLRIAIWALPLNLNYQDPVKYVRETFQHA